MERTEHVFQTWRTDEGIGVELARDLVVKGVWKAAREEVVRCRDCCKAVPVGGGLLCDAWAYWDGSEWMRPDTEPDGFCWKGETDGDR